MKCRAKSIEAYEMTEELLAKPETWPEWLRNACCKMQGQWYLYGEKTNKIVSGRVYHTLAASGELSEHVASRETKMFYEFYIPE